MKTEKLKFIEDGFVSGVVEFKKGQIYDIPVETGSVARWIKRGVAVVVGSAEEREVEVIALQKKLGDLAEVAEDLSEKVEALTEALEDVSEELAADGVSPEGETATTEEVKEPEQDVQEQEQIAKKQPKNQNKKKENLGKGL